MEQRRGFWPHRGADRLVRYQPLTPRTLTPGMIINGLSLAAVVLSAALLLLSWPARPTLPASDHFEGIVRGLDGCQGSPSGGDQGGARCVVVRVEVTAGPDAGQLFELPPVDNDASSFTVGDAITVERSKTEDADAYRFADRERVTVVWIAVVGVALSMILASHLIGLRTAFGLLGSLLLINYYTLPALLNGQSSTQTALLSTVAIVAGFLLGTHGSSLRTSIALLGAMATVMAATGLGTLVLSLSQFSGLRRPDQVLSLAGADVELSGLLLTSVLIGSSGAIARQAKLHANAVCARRKSAPDLRGNELFRVSLADTRADFAGTASTLIMAYVGVALPVILVVGLPATRSLADLSQELVAIELLRALVGVAALGLVAPVTVGVGIWATSQTGAEAAAPGRPPRRRLDPSPIIASDARPTIGQRLRASLED